MRCSQALAAAAGTASPARLPDAHGGAGATLPPRTRHEQLIAFALMFSVKESEYSILQETKHLGIARISTRQYPKRPHPTRFSIAGQTYILPGVYAVNSPRA
jgi:hypothetical protein